MTDVEKRAARSRSRRTGRTRLRPSRRDIVELRERYGLFIGGEWIAPRAARSSRRSPRATRSRSPRSPRPGRSDVEAAVAAAREAFGTWSKLPGSERAKYLFRIARILQERAREFAVLESLNGGKPIKESRDVDLPLAAAHFFYYAGWADKLEYAFPNRSPRPLGVAGQIIPWNFPLLMLAWKLAPALAGGNTVVLKPAETTPLSALLFCDVLRQAELPPGVVNIVTGDGRTGRRARRRPTSTRSRSQARRRSARRSSGGSRAPARSSRSSSAARRRTSSSTTRRSTRRSRGSSTASTSTRATSAARARGSSCRSRSRSR